jgi:hypothetical protein
MGNTRRGAIPSELGWLVDLLDDIEDRLHTLEQPSGENLANSVAKLTDIVTNLQTYLDDYIANELPAIVAAEVTEQINAKLAGNVTIGGNLTVNGTGLVSGTFRANGAVTFPNIPATTFVVEPRAVVWVDTSNGRLGRT